MTNLSNDTICALATPVGGAIAVVRLSGPRAIAIADGGFRPASGRPLSEAGPNTLHYGEIIAAPANPLAAPTNHNPQSSNLQPLDDVVVSLYRAPHSYTGEDCVEISCHGSRYIVRELLTLLQARGARQAEPGEYTRRAYLNGKMDLSQAEAVADLIASAGRASHDLAMGQLRGHVRTALEALRQRLQRLTALLELELDFSDHEDLEFADRAELLALALDIEARLAHLADTYRAGRAIKDGVAVAIVGKPNVGKSTLLNRLLGEDRAIVSDVPGTTRDAIEDTVDIDGLAFRFIDTAGLRHTADRVEQIGIDRAYQAIRRASIVLWLFDTAPSAGERAEMARHCEGKRLILVANKCDQRKAQGIMDNAECEVGDGQPATPSVSISAKTGTRVPLLKEMIRDAAAIPQLHEGDPVISSARQYTLLEEGRAALRRVVSGLQSALPPDLVAEDLRLVLDRLADITGIERVTPQSTLNEIFQHFCIGK